MKWRRILKEKSVQPDHGVYSDWKEIIAEEGFHQCVYCAVPEPVLGGIRNFHVEHYKPKSKFDSLRNDIKNLFYACPICNTFKSNDWPADPLADHSIASYPDPSTVDYSDLFDIDMRTGQVSGRYVASRYVLEKLYLNRPQLIMERRVQGLLDRVSELGIEVNNLCCEVNLESDQAKFYKELAELNYKFYELAKALRVVPAYRECDIQRPN